MAQKTTRLLGYTQCLGLAFYYALTISTAIALLPPFLSSLKNGTALFPIYDITAGYVVFIAAILTLVLFPLAAFVLRGLGWHGARPRAVAALGMAAFGSALPFIALRFGIAGTEEALALLPALCMLAALVLFILITLVVMRGAGRQLAATKERD